MRALVRSAALLLLLLGTACTSVDQVDVQKLREVHGLEFSMDPVPADAIAQRLVVVEDNGFYPFGLFPVLKANLYTAVAEVAKVAHQVQGQGVANLTVHWIPPGLINLFGTPLFPWTGTIRVSGTVWRRPERAR
ncbi:MAG: hypothetical protein IT458_04905 [Planctomycetes bacterium]|nr:hypothetical protein [Planctomycetota bacterium]